MIYKLSKIKLKKAKTSVQIAFTISEGKLHITNLIST